jgi:hypothetical protein
MGMRNKPAPRPERKLLQYEHDLNERAKFLGRYAGAVAVAEARGMAEYNAECMERNMMRVCPWPPKNEKSKA